MGKKAKGGRRRRSRRRGRTTPRSRRRRSGGATTRVSYLLLLALPLFLGCARADLERYLAESRFHINVLQDLAGQDSGTFGAGGSGSASFQEGGYFGDDFQFENSNESTGRWKRELRTSLWVGFTFPLGVPPEPQPQHVVVSHDYRPQPPVPVPAAPVPALPAPEAAVQPPKCETKPQPEPQEQGQGAPSGDSVGQDALEVTIGAGTVAAILGALKLFAWWKAREPNDRA